MVVVQVGLDDHTYVCGDMECELDGDGEPIEPFIYKDGNRTVECFVSQYLYIEKEDSNITKVVHTCTSWSDDSNQYTIKNDKVVYLQSSEHGMNRAYITYTNGTASKIIYSQRQFGKFAIGDEAPLLSDLTRVNRV